MLAALIPAVTELASGYLSNRKEKAFAKQKLAAAKIEAQVTKVQSDASWEEQAIDSSANSIKDELWLVTMVTLNTVVNLGRWIADRNWSRGAYPARSHCVKR